MLNLLSFLVVWNINTSEKARKANIDITNMITVGEERMLIISSGVYDLSSVSDAEIIIALPAQMRDQASRSNLHMNFSPRK